MSRSREVTYEDKMFKLTNISEDTIFIQQIATDLKNVHYAEVCVSPSTTIVCIRKYGEETTFVKTFFMEGSDTRFDFIFRELLGLDR